MQYHSLLIHVSNLFPDQTAQLLEKISPYLAMQYTPNNPDFHLLLHHELEKNSIGIDDVRAFTTLLWQKPFRGDCTVAVIADATVLTPEAQQSLLKILEEPPEHAQIVLLATHPNTLLPTILSRCQMIDIKKEEDVVPKQSNIETQQIADIFTALEQQTLRPSQTIELAQTIGADKTTALQFCEQLLSVVHKKIQSSPSLRLATIAIHAMHTCDRLRKNVSPKMAIESLLFQ